MKNRPLNREKLAALIPTIEALASTRPYSMQEVRTNLESKLSPSIRVILPVPGSTFPVEISGQVKYGSDWSVEVSSGSWGIDNGSNTSLADRVRIYSQTLQLAAAIATVLESAVD